MPRKVVLRACGRDGGAQALEYAALIAVAAVLVLITFNVVPRYVTPAVESAICRMFNGEDCESPSEALPGPPPDSQCVVASNVTDETENHRVLGIGHRSSDSTQVDQQGDGGISITQSGQSGWGVEADVWAEASIPGVLEGKVSIGGGLLWTNSDQDQFTFTDEEQMRRFHDRAARETAAYFDEHGLDGLDEIGDIPYDIAEDMGIPYTHIDASGPTAFVEVSGELGMETGSGESTVTGGGLSSEHSRLIGTSESVDEDGETTYGDYYSVTDALSGELHTGVSYSLGEGAVSGGVTTTGGVNFSTSQSNVVHIEYDDDGNPLRITSSSTTQFHTGTQATVAVGVDVDAVDPFGQPTGGGGVEHTEYVQDGDVAVTTTTIEIPPDMRDRFRDTDPVDWAGQDFDFTGLQRNARISTSIQRYDSHIDGDESGLTLEAGVGVPGLEVGGTVVDWGTSSETNQMGLESAAYRDPVTGEWRDWVTCRGGN
jgi:hypothetical protein